MTTDEGQRPPMRSHPSHGRVYRMNQQLAAITAEIADMKARGEPEDRIEAKERVARTLQNEIEAAKHGGG
jgi:hypothetical protein